MFKAAVLKTIVSLVYLAKVRILAERVEVTRAYLDLSTGESLIGSQ